MSHNSFADAVNQALQPRQPRPVRRCPTCGRRRWLCWLLDTCPRNRRTGQ